jgi:hypothetical protein
MTTTISGSNGIVFPDATSMQTGQQAVKAWVNFNGNAGAVSVNAGFNVSSVTEVSTGSYAVNFTTAMPDSNYAVTIGMRTNRSIVGYVPSSNTTTSASILSRSAITGGSSIDIDEISVAIFR